MVERATFRLGLPLVFPWLLLQPWSLHFLFTESMDESRGTTVKLHQTLLLL